jgi:hypothetical protein
MSIHDQKSNFGNDDVDIVILDEKDSETDTTRRPLSEEKRTEIRKRIERQAELRKMMEAEMKKKDEGKKPEDAETK